MKIIIDATDMVAGRLAAFAAKQALLGYEVSVINAEKAVITGNRQSTLEYYQHKNTVVGVWSKGPFYFKVPDRFLRRLIRGMLPYKSPRGSAAYHRILCYKGAPTTLTGDIVTPPAKAQIARSKSVNYITIQEICKHMGGKA